MKWGLGVEGMWGERDVVRVMFCEDMRGSEGVYYESVCYESVCYEVAL